MNRSTGHALARTRTASAEDPLLLRIKGEYQEMPGLHLTLEQAQRLWHLDKSTCQHLLSQLVADAFLRKNARGSYVKA